MTEDEAQFLGYIRDRLSARFDIKRMILFGSRATGNAGKDSDFDVLVVAESDIPFFKRQGVALQDLGPRSEPVDLLVYTPDEAEEAAGKLGSAVYWAEREGQVFVG